MNGKALELDTPADSGPRERPRSSFALRLGTREYKLKSRLTTAGRSSTADIPLVGALVSRRHATFTLTDGGVEVAATASSSTANASTAPNRCVPETSLRLAMTRSR
jgi:hypothetical protein